MHDFMHSKMHKVTHTSGEIVMHDFMRNTVHKLKSHTGGEIVTHDFTHNTMHKVTHRLHCCQELSSVDFTGSYFSPDIANNIQYT